MVESFVVYTTLMLFMIYLGRVASQKASYCVAPDGGMVAQQPFLSFECLCPLFCFALIFGMRWDVGTDYFAYLHSYLSADIFNYSFEIGFKYLIFICQRLHLHYSVFFSICAFIQVLFFYLAFRNERYIYPFLPFFLFCFVQWGFWMNGIRQGIAVSIFMYATRHIVERKIWKYLLFVVVATLFHTSAIILIIVYPIFRQSNDYFKSIPLQFGLIIVALLINVTLLKWGTYLDSLISIASTATGRYTNYDFEDAILRADTQQEATGGTGIIYYFKLVLCLIPVLYSQKMKKYYNSSYFNLIYSLFFLGIFFEYMFPATQYLLKRPFQYLYVYKVVMLSFLSYYLYKNRNETNRIILFMVILANMAIYIVSCIRQQGFLFFFQDNTI